MIENKKYEEWRAEQLEDQKFREALEDLEPAYLVARLRIERGMTQDQLAKLVGTQQTSIARLESGKNQPRVSFLRRIARALGGKLVIRIETEDEIFQAEDMPVISIATKSDWNTIRETFPNSTRLIDFTTATETPEEVVFSP